MRIYLAAVGFALVAVLGSQPAAWGQFSQRAGSTGGRTMGSSLSAGAGTAFGSGASSAGTVGTVDSSDRFVRGARQQGEFVGGDTQDVRGFVGQVGASTSSQAFGQGRGGQNVRGGQNANRGNTGRGRRTTSEIRTNVRVGFAYAPARTADVSALVASRLQEATQTRTRSPLAVSIVDRTATLRGAVATAHDRALAEQLARLEPGIWRVKNELTVQPQAVPNPAEASTVQPPAPAAEALPTER